MRRLRVAGLVAVIATLVAAYGHRPAPSSSTAAAPVDVRSSPLPRRASPHRGGLGEADGAVPDGTTVFDGDVPGVANLDADLLDALRHAATAAAGDGIELLVDSGWRSTAYQEHLLDAAVSKYGSRQAAARWVASPKASAHVSGHAIDIGPVAAAAWLSGHGDEYGLCQIYGNEPWHYELRPGAGDHGCPAMYADPAHDPRLQEERP